MMIRIFDRYIGRQVGTTMLTGVVVLTGVMVLGNIYKELDKLLGDTKVPLSFVLEFMGLIVPWSLTFIIPWAFLTAILLVFGRLSADNEMVSLRMTGMPMWRICLPVFLMAGVLSAICFWVNIGVAPSAKYRIKTLFFNVATENPIALFQEGRVLDKFPGFRIYTGKLLSDTELENLQIVQLEGSRSKQFIRAQNATLETTKGQQDFVLRLKNANIESVKENETGAVVKVDSFVAAETALKFPLSELKNRTDHINPSMKTTTMLWEEAHTLVNGITGEPLDRSGKSVVLTELNKRYSFSLACLTFALVGIPLAITAQRRETTVGFILSLLTAIVYLVFIILADTLNDKHKLYPHLLMWVPNLLFLGIGGLLFKRLSQK
jgi:lipopolysaccharide export system permease protein